MSDDRDHWAASIVLADGETAFVRPMTSDDAPLLREFHERQPRENVYRRFFSPKPTLSDKELDHFTNIDFHDRVALVMELHGEFVAWASYERWKDRDDAEVAFFVDAAQQGRGIATLLLEHLAAIAGANGIERFTAETLSDNRAMLRVFSRAGWPVERHYDSGLTELEFSLRDTDAYVDSVEQRERRADSRAIARLLLPKSIAVIGASDRPGSIGSELWRNVTSGFQGPVFAVNPARPKLGASHSFSRVTEIDDDVWLAVIAVPAPALAAVIDDCIAKRVRGAVVITSTEDTDIDVGALVAHARRNGLRVIGPASMGIASPPERGGVQAALVPVSLPPGKIAISMQSGTLGASLLQLAFRLSMGISWFVSLGDKCDVSGNDLMQFWEDDESTRVIALYTESFGNPRKFARIARRVGRTRPIVAVRTGTAAVGTATGALYQQAGLVEVPTVRALLDTARVMATQPIPHGPAVAVLSNARSPRTLAEAALSAAGLHAVAPPVPLSWRSTPADFATAIEAALRDDSIDAVMVIHAPPLVTAPAPIAEIDAAASEAAKPIMAIMLGRGDGPLRAGSSVPAFSFPEPAAAVLGRMHAYSRWLRTEAHDVVERLEADHEFVHDALISAVTAGDTALSSATTATVLGAYGLDVPATRHIDDGTAAEIAAAAAAVGYPVVVKTTTKRLGRSAQAGIALDLDDDEAVMAAVDVIRMARGDDAGALIVQRMVEPGLDVKVRCTTDERLGPTITVGLGSLPAGATAEEASRLAPLSHSAAQILVDSTPVAAALAAAGIDDRILVESLIRIAQLMGDNAEIESIDINPLIVNADACWVTDARIIVHEADVLDDAHLPLRRLPAPTKTPGQAG